MTTHKQCTLRAVLTGLLVAPACVAAAPNGTLHQLAKAAGKLYFGTAVDNPELDDPQYRPVVGSGAEFGQITVGNTQKWQFTEPEQNKFDFAAGDVIVDFAKSNSQIVRCHTLVWHNQLPQFVSSGNWDRDSLTRVIESHISNVAGHYKGKCYAWDVVNEALNDDGTFRDSVFNRVLGPDWIPIAFKAAAAADPMAKLYYNDFNIEQPGNKQQAALRIVDLVRGCGATIHGVGFQGHFTVGQTGSKESLASVLNSFAAKDLDVAYTEIDIRHASLPADAQAQQRQADDYAAVVGACLWVQRCVGITVWGASDAHSWVPSTFPGAGDATLLDRNMNPKPAYNRVRDVLAAAGPSAAIRGSVTQAELDTFKLYADYTAAAYCNKSPDRVSQKIVCGSDACPLIEAHETTIVATLADDGDRAGGYVALDSTAERIVVAFHGTITFAGYMADFNALLQDDDLCQGCQIHAGFRSIWAAVGDVVMETVEKLHSEYPDYSIVTTGHSMGAALATLAGANLRQKIPEKVIDVYSLGSPRVGNQAFAEYVSAQPGSVFRITHVNDPVPRLPPNLMGYYHTDVEYWLSTGGALTTDYTPNDVLVCKGIFNRNCNTKSDFFGFGFAAHVNYLTRIGACKP
ncbi:hypothetical protein MCOR08_001161 [Pyricularia oryzae]|nr:hypothetical protein MCOR08_001161 [Pyricularia oryzae]